MAVVEKHNG